MSDSTSNRPTRLPNTLIMDERVSNLNAQISTLNATEDRGRHIINRISSLLHEILEPQAHSVSEKQKVGEKQKDSQVQKISEKKFELTSVIKLLNTNRDQSHYGYIILYTLWERMGDVQDENKNEEIVGQVRNLNQTRERNRQKIEALWRQVRDLHREEVKLTGDKGLVGCKAGKAGISGLAWDHVLGTFSEMALRI